MSAHTKIDHLSAVRPEWAPWLSLVRGVVAEISLPAGPVKLVRQEAPPGNAPLLARMALQPDPRAVAQWLARLMHTASVQGLDALAGQKGLPRAVSTDEAMALFLSAVNGEESPMPQRPVGASAEGWQSLLQLLPMPYLHACARQWIPDADGPWSQGYCPVCAAWPAFAEVRGIARTRHLRCGRCGAGWPKPPLTCTYCGEADHDALSTLVVEDPMPRFTVETCRSCSGYLKSCTTLQPTPPEEIIVTDLASVEFDIAAVERGHFRPPGLGVSLCATLAVDTTGANQASGWWS
jgi:FdhE protein